MTWCAQVTAAYEGHKKSTQKGGPTISSHHRTKIRRKHTQGEFSAEQATCVRINAPPGLCNTQQQQLHANSPRNDARHQTATDTSCKLNPQQTATFRPAHALLMQGDWQTRPSTCRCPYAGQRSTPNQLQSQHCCCRYPQFMLLLVAKKGKVPVQQFHKRN